MLELLSAGGRALLQSFLQGFVYPGVTRMTQLRFPVADDLSRFEHTGCWSFLLSHGFSVRGHCLSVSLLSTLRGYMQRVLTEPWASNHAENNDSERHQQHGEDAGN